MVQRPVGVLEPLPLTIVRPGKVAALQGAPGTGVSVVEAGFLWASVVATDGRRLVLDVLGPGDAVGMPEGEEAPCEIRAASPVRLRGVRGHDAEAALAARHRRDVLLALELARTSAAERVERRLLDLAARVGRPAPGGARIPLLITQDDLAGLAATSRETANRAVRRLLRDGRLEMERRGRYVVRQQLRLVED
ncbi:MAG: Crp/Fnr family transcriptional regulator [Actinomycetota bacterium]